MNKQVLESLIEFIKIDSYAFKKKEILKAQRFVKAYLKDIDIKWEECPSTDSQLAPLLVGKSENWDKNKPSITLTGHLDIVYPDTSDFKIEVKDDKLYGPGTADMKAGIMVILEAVKALQKNDSFKNIQLLFTSEEEHFRTSSFPDFPTIAKSIDTLLVYEGEGSLSDLPKLNTKSLVTKRKGILAYNLKAFGPGGHSGVLSQKSKRHSAVEELITQAQTIKNLTNYSKGTTVNIGIFKGGEALNVIAPKAEITFDTRLETRDEYQRGIKYIEKIKSSDPQVKLELIQLVSGYPVEETKQNKKLLELAKLAGERIGIKIGFVHRGGASDMNRLVGLNPNIASLDYLGPMGGGEHSKGEFLFINSFVPSLKLSLELIKELQK